MPAQPAPTQPQTAPGQQAADAQYYRGVLHELIDMGTDLARRVHQQATPQPAPTTIPNHAIPDHTIPFDRIARAIRRTITLARNVAEPVQPSAAHPGQHRLAARKRTIRDVEDAIQRTQPGAEAESLQAELRDRLDAPDLDDDIAHRPIADIIADICRDLGLAAQSGTLPWKRRTPEDIADLCARAASSQPPSTPSPAEPSIARLEPPGSRPRPSPPEARPNPSG